MLIRLCHASVLKPQLVLGIKYQLLSLVLKGTFHLAFHLVYCHLLPCSLGLASLTVCQALKPSLTRGICTCCFHSLECSSPALACSFLSFRFQSKLYRVGSWHYSYASIFFLTTILNPVLKSYFYFSCALMLPTIGTYKLIISCWELLLTFLCKVTPHSSILLFFSIAHIIYLIICNK